MRSDPQRRIKGETFSSATPRNTRSFASSRELTGAGVDRLALVRPDLIEGGPVGLHGAVSEGARAGVENFFDGRLGEARGGRGVVACLLVSALL